MSPFLRLILLLALDTTAVYFLIRVISFGYYPLAAATFIVLVVVNIILLHRKAYPIRWMVVGLVLMAMFTIYPILFTIWV
ncbi:MAG: hypothetical protein KC423_20190, partial [Anaerolineales bacterium]|nr:hypothetical protein [Anaerolineales bacterium]